MPQIVNTNIASITAQRNLNKSQGALQESLQRLSSGLRINSAKDDAAGLAISNRFTTQIRGLNVAVRNANDGISFAQTTESALDEITTSLQRIRDLAVQSANASNSAADRASLQEEVTQLVSEIDRIAGTTTFNGNKVADGSIDELSFQIGANAGEVVTAGGVDARARALGTQPGLVQSTSSSLAITFSPTAGAQVNLDTFTIRVGDGVSVDVLSEENGGTIAVASLTELTTSGTITYGSGIAKELAARINELREDGVDGLDGVYASARTEFDFNDTANSTNSAEAYVGAGTLQNGDVVINGVDIGPVTVQDRDADGALVNAINAKSNITGVQASTDTEGRLKLTAEDGRDILIDTTDTVDRETLAFNILFDGGDGLADNAAGATLDQNINGFKAGRLTVTAQDTLETLSYRNAESYDVTFGFNVQATGTVANADITTVTGANITIDSIDSALGQVDSYRATLGALQSRFSSTIRNLSAVSESLSAAQSRIRDADFAVETARLTKNQLLQQAGISVLAQANALPQQALSLLG